MRALYGAQRAQDGGGGGTRLCPHPPQGSSQLQMPGQSSVLEVVGYIGGDGGATAFEFRTLRAPRARLGRVVGSLLTRQSWGWEWPPHVEAGTALDPQRDRHPSYPCGRHRGIRVSSPCAEAQEESCTFGSSGGQWQVRGPVRPPQKWSRGALPQHTSGP